MDINDKITLYEYDAVNRLVNVVSPSGSNTQCIYDGVGNRLFEITDGKPIPYRYDADNRLLSAGGIEYEYDNNGNLIRKIEGEIIVQYEYDCENRLTSVVKELDSFSKYQYSPRIMLPQHEEEYSKEVIRLPKVYHEEQPLPPVPEPQIYMIGKRLSKTSANGTTIYFYDVEDILMEFDGNGVEKVRYDHGPKIDEPVSMTRGGDTFYYHVDGLGSVTSLTDVTQNGVATYRYDAFGTIKEETETIETMYGFTGREYDSESHLYYYRARYYDAEVGRFISKHCHGMIDGTNLYTYVGNNPVNRVDPTGLPIQYWKSTRDLCENVFEDCMKKAWDNKEPCLINALSDFSDCYEEAGASAKDATVAAGSIAMGCVTTAFVIGGPIGAGVGTIIGMAGFGVGMSITADNLRKDMERCDKEFARDVSRCRITKACTEKEKDCWSTYSLPLRWISLRRSGTSLYRDFLDNKEWYCVWIKGHTGLTEEELPPSWRW